MAWRTLARTSGSRPRRPREAAVDEELRRQLGKLRWRGRKIVREARQSARMWSEEPAFRVLWRNQLVRPWRVSRFHHFGKMSVVDRPVCLYGAHHIHIDDYVGIGPGSWLAVERVAWDKPAPILRIDERVLIRQAATISAAESIVIEPYVGMGGFCTIVDSNHLMNPNTGNVFDGNVTTSPIRIGAGTWLGDRVAVLAGADIGKGCFIGTNSVVNKAIPDFSVALGHPARVVGSTLSE